MLIVFLCFGLQCYSAWLPTNILVSRIVTDDAFYYIKTIRNFVQGHGVSFDGINKTNGFHPLWGLLLIPISLIPSTPAVFLHIVLTYSALLNAVTGIILFRLLELVTDHRWALLGVTIYCYFMIYTISHYISLSGMESSAYFFTLSLAIYWTLKRYYRLSNPVFSQYLVGLAWGLLALTRLDTIPFIALFLCGIWWKQRHESSPIINYRTILVFGATLAPYFLYNYIVFEHFSTISSTIKLSQRPKLPTKIDGFYHIIYSAFLTSWHLFDFVFPFISFRSIFPYNNILKWMSFHFIFFSFGAVIVGFYLSRRQSLSYRPALTILTILGLYSGILLVGINATMPLYKDYCKWYYIPFFLYLIIWCPLSFFTLHKVFKTHIKGKPFLNRLIDNIVVFIIAGGVLFYFISYPRRVKQISSLHPQENDRNLSRYDMALWIRDNLPEHAIYATHHAGILGYFSERRLINLDGLANNFELFSYKQRYLQKQKQILLYDYLKNKRVQYIICFGPTKKYNDSKRLFSIPVTELRMINSFFTYHNSMVRSLDIYAIVPKVGNISEKSRLNRLYLAKSHNITELYKTDGYVEQLKAIIKKLNTLTTMHDKLNKTTPVALEMGKTKDYAILRTQIAVEFNYLIATNQAMNDNLKEINKTEELQYKISADMMVLNDEVNRAIKIANKILLF